jgi:hypothetical protein
MPYAISPVSNPLGKPPDYKQKHNYGYEGVSDMQVNVAPLNVVYFQGNFPHKVSHWHVQAFFEEVHQVDFGFSIFENNVSVVVEVSFGFLLGSKNRFEDGYDWL